ncbi:MAG: septal ring lytic transglycosylase RlpA family protein [Desulfobulbaceae bacterium]|nr:septal ring lytic transglycosylase RlpA family protein [Desulfobulbaceae bacterium]
MKFPSSRLPAVLVLLFFCAGLFLWGCAPRYPQYETQGKKIPATQRPYKINGKTYYPIPSSRGFRETGMASWYGGQFHGRKTACGETYNMYGGTAAHKTLPMHTMVLVRNLENGRETVVRINDRGPFLRGRVIDLSYAAAEEIGMVRNGTARAEIIALGEAAGSAGGADSLRFQDFDTGIFYIQVGSFVNKDNATRLAGYFIDLGMKCAIMPHAADGRNYHRVQVYAGTSLNAARLLEQQILGRGFPGSFVVAR